MVCCVLYGPPKHTSPYLFPLTARVVRTSKMISQPVSSIFLCSPLPSWTWQTPCMSIPWFCLPTSSPVCLVFLPLSLCLARWFWQDLMNGKHDYTTAVCVFLRSSGDLHEVQLPAGSSQRKSRSYCWASVDVPERRKREGRGERLKRPKTWSSFECLWLPQQTHQILR